MAYYCPSRLSLGPTVVGLTSRGNNMPMASNQGHLRVVIFVLLRGVIFGVLGQAQGSQLQKNCRKSLLFDPVV